MLCEEYSQNQKRKKKTFSLSSNSNYDQQFRNFALEGLEINEEGREVGGIINKQLSKKKKKTVDAM